MANNIRIHLIPTSNTTKSGSKSSAKIFTPTMRKDWNRLFLRDFTDVKRAIIIIWSKKYKIPDIELILAIIKPCIVFMLSIPSLIDSIPLTIEEYWIKIFWFNSLMKFYTFFVMFWSFVSECLKVSENFSLWERDIYIISWIADWVERIF